MFWDRRKGLPVGGRLFFFCCEVKLYWKRRHIGTSAKKNHAYESPFCRVQILIILYSNAPYIAIANKNMSQSCLTISNGRSRRMAEFHCIVKKERTTINCPLFISYKFNFQSLSKCSCRQPQCLGYGVPLCYNILPSPNRITITSSSEIASMLHGTYPRRYVFSSSLSIAYCMRLVSFSDLLL